MRWIACAVIYDGLNNEHFYEKHKVIQIVREKVVNVIIIVLIIAIIIHTQYIKICRIVLIKGFSRVNVFQKVSQWKHKSRHIFE